MKPNTKFGSHLPEKRATFKDGGIVEHGTPIGLQKPSTRKRPKVGDKDPNWKKPEKGPPPKQITTPGKPGDSGPGGAHPGKNPPKKPKPKKPKYNHRDYRGTDGAIEDAGG